MRSSKKSNIEHLIEGCINNNRKSQKDLYERYFGLMMSISMRYCSDWDEAKEVVNTGFLKVFLKIKDYSGKGSFEGWMKRIIVNSALDYIKSLKQPTVEIDDKNTYESDLYVDNEALNDFSVDDIIKHIQALPPMSRAVFNMYVMEGYKHKDISKELGISEGTCHWHLQNARKILQTKISKF
ncbi:MAG: hypothetical protein DRI86_14615 [Bacteroidetes bacterium]|nr:MAG: hypothetical protein DRI86_14615 [Bacteroidota bacterium]